MPGYMPQLKTDMDLTPGLNALARKPLLEQQFQQGQLQNQLAQKQLDEKEDPAKNIGNLIKFSQMNFSDDTQREDAFKKLLPNLDISLMPNSEETGEDITHKFPTADGRTIEISGKKEKVAKNLRYLGANPNILQDAKSWRIASAAMAEEGVGVVVTDKK